MKKLDATGLQNELQGSAFFSGNGMKRPVGTPQPEGTNQPAAPQPSSETTTPRHHGPTVSQADTIEVIRSAVRQHGKEDATYRFTGEEKKALTDIVYTYSSAGIRTSQNEVTRIAINWLVEDYRANGQGSVLARVMERLNA